MIDLFQRGSSLDAKTAPCWVRLSNLKHTVPMKEAESNVPRVFTPVKRPWRIKDLSGMRFGRWTVIGLMGSCMIAGRWWPFFKCRCDCGIERDISGAKLKNGRTLSCGCRIVEINHDLNTIHGMSYSKTYATWGSMKSRCLNPHANGFEHYGGRGIGVCERWKTFDNFFADMGIRPDGLTLDRKDNTGGYWCGKCEECIRLNQPENCRWASCKQQSRNRRTNTLITANGKTMCVAEWAESSGINSPAIFGRLRKGWNPEIAVTKPLRT
jgi:hypothetical protein